MPLERRVAVLTLPVVQTHPQQTAFPAFTCHRGCPRLSGMKFQRSFQYWRAACLPE